LDDVQTISGVVTCAPASSKASSRTRALSPTVSDFRASVS
jgi:hypothetical protein